MLEKLEKFKNKEVFIHTVGNWFGKGIVNRVEADFIELEYKGKNMLVSTKYITVIREI